MKTKLTLFLALLMLAVPGFMHAKTSATTESVAIQTIVAGIRAYQTLKGGRTPTNWTMIREIMNIDKLNAQTLANSLAEFRDIDGLNRDGYPFKRFYVFMTSSQIPLPESENGNVFLIRTIPATNGPNASLGRYVVSRNEGDLMVNWMPEEKIQKCWPRPESLNYPNQMIPALLIMMIPAE